MQTVQLILREAGNTATTVRRSNKRLSTHTMFVECAHGSEPRTANTDTNRECTVIGPYVTMASPGSALQTVEPVWKQHDNLESKEVFRRKRKQPEAQAT